VSRPNLKAAQKRKVELPSSWAFFQFPEDYNEPLICLAAAVACNIDYLSIDPKIQQYVQRNFITRHELIATDRWQKEVAEKFFYLQFRQPTNWEALATLGREHDRKDWFIPIDKWSYALMDGMHQYKEALTVCQDELNRLEQLGLPDDDFTKQIVLRRIAICLANLSRVEESKSFFRRASKSENEMRNALDGFADFENYQVTAAMANVYFERYPHTGNVVQEACAYLSVGKIEKALEVIDKSLATLKNYQGVNNILLSFHLKQIFSMI